MKTSSRLSKIFLVAMVRELYRTGLGETNFEKVFSYQIVFFWTNMFI